MGFKEFLEQAEIKTLAKKAGIDISGYDQSEVIMGVEEEKEHNRGKLDVVKKDEDLLKIAIAHLREDPRYYSKLKKVM